MNDKVRQYTYFVPFEHPCTMTDGGVLPFCMALYGSGINGTGKSTIRVQWLIGTVDGEYRI